MAAGAVLALSFLSYVPEAPKLNQVGPFGYWLASLLVQSLGLAAYLFPVILGAGAVALFVGGAGIGSPIRFVGGAALLLEAAVMLGLYRPTLDPELAGGWIGGFLATLMSEALGLAGATVVVAALAMLTWLMLTGTPLSQLLAGIFGGVAAAGVAALSAVGRGLRWLVSPISTLLLRLRLTRERNRAGTRRATEALLEDDPPVVFGGQDVEVSREKAGGILEISKPKITRPEKRSRKKADETEQEEFVFALEHDDFRLPSAKLLGKHDEGTDHTDEKTLVAQSKVLEQKLATFGVAGRVTAVRPGPVITTFEFEPDAGIKVSRVVNLCDDLTMALRAHGVRIVAPIPGKNVVGIEVSNRHRAIVGIRDLIDSDEYRTSRSPLTLVLGRDTTGQAMFADLTRMPHLLMAGATGTGKSVSLNTLIVSMLYKCTPRDVRFIMIDPKMLELSLYEGIPHLLVPVVTDVRKAAAALANVMREMDRRFELMKDLQVRSIDDYNVRVAEGVEEEEAPDHGESEAQAQDVERAAGGDDDEREATDGEDEAEDDDAAQDGVPRGPKHQHLPRIVVIVDELADLMMTVGREVEISITRLAQKARAAGIHLIVATQRPSVDVITGLIKANFPSRISFQVTARPDSRTILDTVGAERLLGMGDLLYMAPGTSFLQRLHGPLITDKEIRTIVEFLKKQGDPEYWMDLLEDKTAPSGDEGEEFFDELYDRAVDLVLENGQGSTSWLQRKLAIGYNRAARIMEHMEREGVVGPADGVKPRKVMVGHAAG